MTEKQQHPHAEFLRAIADGETLDDWDCRHATWLGRWQSTTVARIESIITNPDDWKVRRKTRKIKIGDMEIDPPMRVAPKIGSRVWVANPTVDSGIQSAIWDSAGHERAWLRSGMIHSTEQAAEEHRRALILVSGGTP